MSQQREAHRLRPREQSTPPTSVRVAVTRGPTGFGVQLDAFNNVVSLLPGGPAAMEGADLHAGDKVLGVEVAGRIVLCGTQPLARILPRDAGPNITLLVLRKRSPPPPTATTAPPSAASSGASALAPRSSFEVRVQADATAAGPTAWPTPREFLPSTPALQCTRSAVALPRPPTETAAAILSLAFR